MREALSLVEADVAALNERIFFSVTFRECDHNFSLVLKERSE
jgi:hypothetical protein